MFPPVHEAVREKTSAQPTEGNAIYYCEMRAQDNLKTPSSADFPYPDTIGEYPSWTVTGVVDSKNAFGEASRREYQCEIVFGGAGAYKSSLNYLRSSPDA